MKSWKNAKTIVDYAKGTTMGEVIQVGVVFLRLGDNLVMKMYVNGLFQWQYTIPFNPEWTLLPGDLYYGSAWNESQMRVKVGMASFFGLPLSGDDMNQMYWLQRDNLKFT